MLPYYLPFLALPIALNVLAKALRFGVQVALVIGVQNPLCLGFTAFCIQFLSLAIIRLFHSILLDLVQREPHAHHR
jgi:hypothetical protein